MSIEIKSSLDKFSIVPSGNLANASSVGAKTVNEASSLVRASTNSADITASTRLVKIPASMAISAIVLASGNEQELVDDDEDVELVLS